MLRNFIRDRGRQFTLGTFVATFVYATLVLISIGPRAGGPDFVPHLSITVAVVLVTVSMVVLIYFIHHIASSIQLPRVIASIAGDLSRAIDAESTVTGAAAIESGPSVAELMTRLAESGGIVPAPSSGYLQFIRHETLIRLAAEKGAVIRLLHRPGQFAVRGHPMATDWHPIYAHRDEHGYVRVITAHVSYESLVERAFEKIRQAGRGMPAVSIRQLEALRRIMEDTTLPAQRELLLEQAEMIRRASEESVPEPSDRADVGRELDELLAASARMGALPG